MKIAARSLFCSWTFIVLFAEVISLHAENGKILRRTEMPIRAELLQANPFLARLSNIVERVQFWKITYESDALKINGYMLGPKGKKSVPCIIMARGGNRDFSAWTDTNVVGLATLADAGYFLIASNYRGAGGSEGQDEFGGRDVNDILNLFPMIDSLKEEIDPTRIGISGASRGGMMTYLTLARTKRVSAVVITSGIADLENNGRERPEMEKNVFAELIPGYATNRVTALQSRSALRWPEKLAKDTPILLLAGTGDWRVNPMDSLHMAEKLYKLKHPYRLMVFEGGDHGLSEFALERRQIIREWFDRYLRDKQPWPSLEPHGN